MLGDPDIASVAVAFADERRVRVLMALADGRALPASRLAEEAGVAASTITGHLHVLLDRGIVSVTRQGRHRYYRIATAQVEGVLEALARIAPRKPITSLRQHTRARALRQGRTCYRHLAGELGVALFAGMLGDGWVVGGSGRHDPHSTDRLSAPGRALRYRLTARGADRLSAWGVAAAPDAPLRYCVDWTEQAHHLAGPVGAAVADRFFETDWIRRTPVPRSVVLTDAGRDGLAAAGLITD